MALGVTRYVEGHKKKPDSGCYQGQALLCSYILLHSLLHERRGGHREVITFNFRTGNKGVNILSYSFMAYFFV